MIATQLNSVSHLIYSFMTLGIIETTLGVHSFTILLNSDQSHQISRNELSTLSFDEELSHIFNLFHDKDKLFQRFLKNSENFSMLTQEIQIIANDLLKNANKTRNSIFQKNKYNVLASNLSIILLEQCDMIGWKHVLHLNEDLSFIKFNIQDLSQRNHEIDVYISPDYPKTKPIIQISLPEVVDYSWIPETSSLKSIYDEIQRVLYKYEDLFQV